MEARIAIAPSAAIPGAGRPNDPGLDRFRAAVSEAIADGGGSVVPIEEANGLVWLAPGGPEPLIGLLREHPGVGWIQLPWAGVEHFTEAFRLPAQFTCAKGSYAPQVSEHALLLILACLRSITAHARTPRWLSIDPRSLHGRSVTILGGGGIASELVKLLAPFGCTVRILRRHPGEGELPASALHDVLPTSDVLVLALSLTPQTRHIIGAEELKLLPPHAVVVNVARGPHIDTDALVAALAADEIAAAGLDVTDPEPLPDGHPLWADDRVLITSHCADSSSYVMEMLCARVTENVRRLRAGSPLVGMVDSEAGY